MRTYCIAQGLLLSALWWPKWEGNPKEREDICIHKSDLLCCTAETNNIVKQWFPKVNEPWIFIGRTNAEAKPPKLWPLDTKSQLIGKDPDTGKDWGQEEKGDDRGWDDWMASLTQWTWTWANSGRWWRTGKPGVRQSMVSQRVGHDLVTRQEQQQQHCKATKLK